MIFDYTINDTLAICLTGYLIKLDNIHVHVLSYMYYDHLMISVYVW